MESGDSSVQPNAPSDTSPMSLPGPVSPKDFLKLIRSLKPAQVFHTLQTSEFSAVASRIYVGFRPSPGAINQNVVQSRLAAEAAKNTDLVTALVSLSTSTPPVAAPPLLKPAELNKQLESNAAALVVNTQAEAKIHKSERDSLRKVNRELQEKIDSMNDLQAAGAAQLKQVQADHETKLKEISDLNSRLAKLQRQSARSKRERELYLNSASTDANGKSTRSEPREKPVSTPSLKEKYVPAVQNSWSEAARRIERRGDQEAAFLFAAEVLSISPEDVEAAKIAIDCLLSTGQQNLAVPRLQQLCNVLSGKDNFLEYCRAIVSLVQYASKESQYAAHVKAWAKVKPFVSTAEANEIRGLFSRLAAIRSERAARLIDILQNTPGGSLFRLITEARSNLSVTSALPDGHAYGLTTESARSVIEGIIAGDIDRTAKVVKYISHLKDQNTTTFASVEKVLKEAATDYEEIANAVLKPNKGPIVLDVSNVAWFDQENVVKGSPKLKSVRSVLKSLRELNYFPIIGIADAPLPHTIDKATELQNMLKSGEVILADKGTDADEVICRTAKRLHAPIVTNDYMDDWDSANEIAKFGFTISPSGRANLIY